jgi:hypothetical protein
LEVSTWFKQLTPYYDSQPEKNLNIAFQKLIL